MQNCAVAVKMARARKSYPHGREIDARTVSFTGLGLGGWQAKQSQKQLISWLHQYTPPSLGHHHTSTKRRKGRYAQRRN